MIIEKNSCTLSRKSVQKVFGGDFFSYTACRRVKQACFTLIELLVITAQHCRDFFKRFVCTDKYGCVRKHTENAAPGGCEVAKLVLCGEDVKTAAVPPYEVPLMGCGCVNGCVLGQTSKFAQSQNTPLFLKEKGSARGKENFGADVRLFLVKKSCLFPSHQAPLLS